jgi:hypothetical protein
MERSSIAIEELDKFLLAEPRDLVSDHFTGLIGVHVNSCLKMVVLDYEI